MKTRTAAPVIITASLVVLMSGCAGAAVQGGQVQDFLSPEGNAAVFGLARGHVIADQDLANRVDSAIEQARQADAARAWSADARREFHAAAPEQSLGTTPWSADALREFHASAPVGVSAADMQGARLNAYAEAQAAAGRTAADMQGARLSAYAEAQAAAGVVQSQFDTAEIARREAAFIREQVRGNVGTTEPSTQVNGALRLVKQQEARTAAAQAEAVARSAEALRLVKQEEARSAVSTTPTSSRGAEAMRLEKQNEARDAAEQLRQHQLEHGASSDRLR